MAETLRFIEQYNTFQGRLFVKGVWTQIATPKYCPRQRDNASCGVFVCVLSDLISRGKPSAGKSVDVNFSREYLNHILLQSRFQDEQFPSDPNSYRESLREITSQAAIVASITISFPENPERDPSIPTPPIEPLTPSVHLVVEESMPEDHDVIDLDVEALEEELGPTTSEMGLPVDSTLTPSASTTRTSDFDAPQSLAVECGLEPRWNQIILLL